MLRAEPKQSFAHLSIDLNYSLANGNKGSCSENVAMMEQLPVGRK